MRRLLWLGVGLAVGALVVRKLTQAAHSYSPAGVLGAARESAVGAVDSVRDYVAEVREGMAEHEAALHEAFAQGITIDEALGAEDPSDYYGAHR